MITVKELIDYLTILKKDYGNFEVHIKINYDRPVDNIVIDFKSKIVTIEG